MSKKSLENPNPINNSLEYLFLLEKKMKKGKLSPRKYKHFQHLLSEWYINGELKDSEDAEEWEDVEFYYGDDDDDDDYWED